METLSTPVPRVPRAPRSVSVLPGATVYLQRHGESETNVAGLFTCRRLEPNLTEDGRAQIAARMSFYRQAGIKRIVTSPSRRARQTATILGEGLRVPVTTDEALLEVDVGRMEGLSDRDPALHAQFMAVMTDWLRDGKDSRYPGGESLSDVMARVPRIFSLGGTDTLRIGHCALFAVVMGTHGMPFTDVAQLFLPRGGAAMFDAPAKAWRVVK
jgi:broad specificity phosphatase PhoE